MTKRYVEATEQPTSLELAWAAGFLEGEGCFTQAGVTKTVNGNGFGSIYVSASQVEWEPLARLVRWFGGYVNSVDPKPWAQHKQRCYLTWKCGGSRAAGVMMTIYPLMSPKRQERIRELLAMWLKAPVTNRDKARCNRGHEFTPENTRILASGSRFCRACARRRSQQQVARNRLREMAPIAHEMTLMH